MPTDYDFRNLRKFIASHSGTTSSLCRRYGDEHLLNHRLRPKSIGKESPKTCPIDLELQLLSYFFPMQSLSWHDHDNSWKTHHTNKASTATTLNKISFFVGIINIPLSMFYLHTLHLGLTKSVASFHASFLLVAK